MLEAALINLWKHNTRYRVIALYNPPNNKPDMDKIGDKIDAHTLIIGDFNAPSRRWSYKKTTATGVIIKEFFDDNLLDLLKSGPTFLFFNGHTSRPDLAMVHSNIRARTALRLLDAKGGNGHKVLEVTIRAKS